MRELTADEIRSGFINLDRGEAERVPMPGLHEMLWSDREFLGWRDPGLAGRGYLAFDGGDRDGVVSLVVRRAETGLARAVTAMCSLCRSTQPISQVALFSAARAGQRGRDGSTVGTYICDDLDCPHKIRMLPSTSPFALEPGDLLARRSSGLLERLRGFAAVVASAGD
jgi:hypothetical protein